MNIFCIYTIHNILNNKIYVGKSSDSKKRWLKHIKIARAQRTTEKFVIHKALAKYGINNFIFSTLQFFNNETDCSAAEIYWIKHFQSNIKEFGYNLTEGGEGCTGRVITETTKEKMRLKAIGRKHTVETKNKLRVINIGRIPSNIEQLKTINVGKKLSNNHKQKISDARKGIIFTKEHKQNMSKALTGLLIGNKNPFFGKKHTEEVKEKSRGECNKQSKLTSNQVIEIRYKYDSKKLTQQQLADEYHVSRKTIGNIINKTTWSHI